ncbi:MAG: hypothetical protein R3F60_02075 [bacterium]
MRVGYSRPLAVSFIALGALVLGLNLITARRGADLIRLVPGIVCGIVGVGYLAKPYFYLEGGAIVVPAVLGPLKKTYPFKPGELSVRDGAIWLGEKKLGMRRWLADKAAWDDLARQIQAADTFA